MLASALLRHAGWTRLTGSSAACSSRYASRGTRSAKKCCATRWSDLAHWVLAVERPELANVASVVADAHHRFQWIHPFQDTNGRTGRVLDHYILWVTFGLHGSTRETSPVIEYFPTEREENDYYEGLSEAYLGRPERLHSFYVRRLVALFEAT
jgi:hypothetical protein